VRQKICGSLNNLQVLNFARKSESGHKPVGPASQENFLDLLYTIGY